MNSIEEKCRQLWYKAVHARDRWCIITGNPFDKHAHHIFGRDPWIVGLDIDYGVCVCTEWHTSLHGTGPHPKSEAFEKLLNRLWHIDEIRAAKVAKFAASPAPQISPPHWPDVLKWCKDQYKAATDAADWNDDIEPAFGRTVL